jgi:hypothetical protein
MISAEPIARVVVIHTKVFIQLGLATVGTTFRRGHPTPIPLAFRGSLHDSPLEGSRYRELTGRVRVPIICVVRGSRSSLRPLIRDLSWPTSRRSGRCFLTGHEWSGSGE